MSGPTMLRPGGVRTTESSSRYEHLLISGSSVALVFVLWWLAGAQTRFIPPIGDVLGDFGEFATSSQVHAAVLATVSRVLGSLIIALAVGFLAALAMARENFAAGVVRVFVNFAMAFPSTIAALLALYIFRRSPVSVYVVVAFITFPFVATILEQGLKGLDKKVEEMASVYGYGRLDALRHVVIPQLTPYFFSALRNEYAHAWKVVVLAELFAVNSGMGWKFSQAFDHFLLKEVILWLLVFMVILLSTEYFMIRPVERYVLRWRRS